MGFGLDCHLLVIVSLLAFTFKEGRSQDLCEKRQRLCPTRRTMTVTQKSTATMTVTQMSTVTRTVTQMSTVTRTVTQMSTVTRTTTRMSTVTRTVTQMSRVTRTVTHDQVTTVSKTVTDGQCAVSKFPTALPSAGDFGCEPSKAADAASVAGLGVALAVALLLLLTVSVLLAVAVAVARVQTVKLRVYEAAAEATQRDGVGERQDHCNGGLQPAANVEESDVYYEAVYPRHESVPIQVNPAYQATKISHGVTTSQQTAH